MSFALKLDTPKGGEAAAKTFVEAVRAQPELACLDDDGMLASALQMTILAFQARGATAGQMIDGMAATIAFMIGGQTVTMRQAIVQRLVHEAFRLADNTSLAGQEIAGHA